jgi:hypothetical protein
MSQTMNEPTSGTGPFIPTAPGDLITADLVNGIQVETRAEIERKIRAAVAGVTEVDRARDAAKLEGKTLKELADEIVRRALEAIPRHTNYRVIYKRLLPGEPAVIKHGLKAYPLTDVYQLGHFPVVSSADAMQTVENAYWYLYHRTEMKIRRPKIDGAAADPTPITIEESRPPVFKHTFQSMLDLYGVRYTEQSTLGDVVNEFWKALFADPNDAFDETTFANSPWFDRCCGDRRTVESLKRGGEWNDLYLKVMPLRTINAELLASAGVLVEHYNLDELGLWWVPRVFRNVSTEETVAGLQVGRDLASRRDALDPEPGKDVAEEIRVMVVLKV